MVVTRRGVRVASPAKSTPDRAPGVQISPSTGRTSRRPLKPAESQSTHLEQGENEHQASPTVKRCSRARRLHSPEQPATTPAGSARNTDVSDVESVCSVVSDVEMPLTRSRGRAKMARGVSQGDEELSEVESCSSALSVSSPGRKARRSARKKTVSQRSDAVPADARSAAVSTPSRVTRSQRKAASNRFPPRHTDDSELSDPDSCLSSISGAEVPSSSTRRAPRSRRPTGPVPVNTDKAGDRTSLTLTPVRQSSRVAARRKTPAAVEANAPQSCDSEGFESGTSSGRKNRRRKILDSDSDLSDSQSPESSPCSKGSSSSSSSSSSSHASPRSKSPEIPVVSRQSVHSVSVLVESAEPSLHDSRLENTLIAEDEERTLLGEDIERDPRSGEVDLTEETKASERDSRGLEDAAVAASRQQEELCEETQKADASELEEMQEKAVRVTDVDPLRGDEDDDAAAEPPLCEEEEDMEARAVESDGPQVVECLQVTSTQERVRVDSVCEREPGVITVQKKEFISLLDSSEEEEDDDDEEEGDKDREVSETEGERGVPSSQPGPADVAVDGLFVIDTRPGQEADGQYYMDEEGEGEKKKAPEDHAEEEEEFVDEEEEDDDEDADLLYSSRNPLLKEMSSRIDPGIRVKQLGGLYINFDGGKSKAVSSSLAKLKEKKIQDEAMKKSVIAPDFEKKDAVPPYSESKQASKLKRRVEKEKTTGDGWFNMKAPELSQELKGDLQLLKMRGSLDPKRFYKKNDRDGFPKYFQVGTVVDDPVDFYHSRIPKKNRKRTMVEELLADAEFRQKNKKKYQQIVAEKVAQAAGKKNKRRRFHQKSSVKKQ